MSDLQPGGISPIRNRSFSGAIPAQYILVEYIETYRNGLNLSESLRLKAVRTQGRRPHVPSSKSQCQRAAPTSKPDNQCSLNSRSEDQCPSMWATEPVKRLSSAAPSGEKPSRRGSRNRQTLFAILFHIFLAVPV